MKSSNFIRFFDILFSILGLVILSPLFILLFIFTAVTTGGRVIFRQERVGYMGKIFILFKFRTMKDDSKNGLLITAKNDPRVTGPGRFIRKLKLDELPQLYNVLKGDMSIVGPRPEVLRYVSRYTQEQREILSVLPGITDLASVYFKNEEFILMNQDDPEKYYIESILPEKIKLNKRYIENYGLKTYFAIVIKTIISFFHDYYGKVEGR